MLFLLFRLDSDTYALDACEVVEVLPFVSIAKALRPQRGVIGTINYHGTFVPVVDLSEILLGRRAPPRLSTRIVLVRRSPDGKAGHLLGLVAEKATDTMQCDPAKFVSCGIDSKEVPYLGAVAMVPAGLVQRIEVDKLLPAAATA